MPSEPAPPPLLTSLPPPSNVPPLLSSPAPAAPRYWLAVLLSLFVWAFLVDAVVSLADVSLIGLANSHALSILELLTSLAVFLMGLLVYILMAFISAIPKRWFVPLALFGPVLALVGLPVGIYYYQRAELVGWLASAFQVVFGLAVLYGLKKMRAENWRGH